MALSLIASVYMHKHIVFTPMHLPLRDYTPERMTQYLKTAQFDHYLTFPARLEGALQNVEYADELKKVKYIMFGGGNVPPICTSIVII